jgi:hypothetical protein
MRTDTANHAQQVRTWLRHVMRQTGMKPSPLAKAAGLSPSTLLRALDDDSPSSLERVSILKIMKAFNVSGPDEAEMRTIGFSETELLPYAPESPVALAPNQYVKIVNTRALELAGYMPGDLATFDMSASPVAGDVVEAQIYSGGTAETAFRLYDPPYLTVRTLDPAVAAKPLLVDGERIRIAAVLVRSERTRRPPRG